MIGETVGSYQIVSAIGTGATGIVYLAEHPLLGKRAAVKVLHRDASADPDRLERFFNEARACSQLEHPGIIHVFDFGHHGNGSAFILMEYCDGESLAARIRADRRIEEALNVEVSRQIVSALRAAHAQGIIHRDLKPDNIYLVPAPDLPSGVRVKVLDFGVAKLMATGSHKTLTGEVLGTPAFMSPEQCRNAAAVDARSDIYSLGCIMYKMASGHPPFDADNRFEILNGQINEEPSPLGALVSPALGRLIHKALAKRPEDRQPTMAALGVELAALASPAVTRWKVRVTPRIVPASATPAAKAAPRAMATANLSDLAQPAAAAPSNTPTLRVGTVAAAFAIAFFASVLAVVVVNGASPPVSYGTPSPRPRPAPIATAAKTTPKLVTHTIDSQPRGARVFRVADGALVGETPHRAEIAPADARVLYSIRLSGYDDAQVSFDGTHDGESTIVLQPRAGSAGSAAKKAPAPATQKLGADAQIHERDLLDPF